jgi:hypothetical protein
LPRRGRCSRRAEGADSHAFDLSFFEQAPGY